MNVGETATKYYSQSGKGLVPQETVVVLTGSQQEEASPFLLQPQSPSSTVADREPTGKAEMRFEESQILNEDIKGGPGAEVIA